MEVKGANPFLFTEDDYVSPNSGNSNPFLMGDDDFMEGSGGNDNPFLSQSAATVAPAATATNPFAFDPMDLEPSEAAQAATFQDAFNDDNFIHSQEAANIFTEASSVSHNFLIDTNVSIPSIVPQKPTDLDLKFTNTVASDFEAGDNGGPKRPPPPRPPPSKETQDLLMSVMGEMDAASTHLLDRIPPTRTPSPVSMRDLHSPSPTPEPQFGDLLDVSDAKTDTGVKQGQPNQAEDLFMSLADDDDENCDINQNPPVMEQPMQPIMQQPQPMMQQPPQPMMQQPQPMTQSPQPMMQQSPQPMMQQSQPMTQSPQPMMQSPQPMMQQPQPMTQSPQPMMQQPPKPMTQQPQPIMQQPQPMLPQQQQPVQPPRPIPPVRPPPPQRPQKPPQPNFAQQSPAQISGPPPKPPPPAIPQPPAAKPDEFMDMFGMQPPQAQKSMADIMNLYNTKQETPVDLLSDSLDTAMPGDAAETSISESNSRKSSVPSSDNTVVNATATQNATSLSPQNTQDSFPSPQQDMQMDTSDSQSKESISSVTFNPFAAVEETSPTNPSAIPTQDFGSSLDNGVFHEEMPEITERIVQETNVNEQKTTISSIFGVTDNNAYQDTTNTEVEDMFGSTEATQQDIFGSTNTNQDAFGITETSVTQDNFGGSNQDAFGSMTTNQDAFGSNQDAFGTTYPTTNQDAFGTTTNQDMFATTYATTTTSTDMFASGFGAREPDAFDAFTAKFESVKEEKNGNFDAFGGGGGAGGVIGGVVGGDTWGNDGSGFNDSSGFGGEETFDAFLAMKEPPAVPQSTPNRFNKVGSLDSDEEKDFSVVIRPKSNDDSFGGALPVLAPPPVPTSVAFSDNSRINPFDQTEFAAPAATGQDFALPMGGEMKRSDSQETPPTPLFDDDVSQPLLPFPRVDYTEDGWEMHLRQPNKKKITGQRFWKKIFVRLVFQQDCVLLQLYNQPSDKDPFQELPLQPCYSVSEIGAQQYDNFGKIFTLKLQYIFYKERPGVRPGQVKKAERITNKLSQFAAYAIQGDYQGCKEFGSDLKKLGLPVEHAPQVSQLMKLGSLNFEDLKEFSVAIEESLFKLQAHRDRALHYKMEEVQVTAVDELYVEQDAEGHIEKQIARVRLFFLGFLTGMPDIELGVNDMRRQGKEVVGRHDIIPVVTEEWIRLENVEFHSCVQQDEYNATHIIKFKPPDACYIELLRFRVRPPKNRELPLQLKAQICITGNKVELRADVLVPGFASRKLGQVPCEDVMIRFPIPECWIYMFRVEKHFRYGSVKSAHRRTGKIKGIERILGTVDTLQESLIEVTSGQAKYEHQHRAIVWRCPRLPKEGQGAYTTHNMVCRLSLTSYDQMPDALAEYAFVEFTMPATQVSHTTVRSVSLQNSDSDEPPEKYVRYLARHEYRVGIEHTEGEGPSAYAVATQVKAKPVPEEKPAPIPEAESSSDSD